MKRIIFSAAIIVVAASCKKHDHHSQSMTVVRDCTGTYLRFENKDYQVCNLEAVNKFSDGETVRANFKKITDCNGSAKDVVVCYMLHPNEGWIEVQYITQ